MPDRTGGASLLLPLTSKDKDSKNKEENHKLLNGNSGDPTDRVQWIFFLSFFFFFFFFSLFFFYYYLLLFFLIKCYHSWSQLPLTSNGNSSSRKSNVEVKVVGSIPIGRVITDKIIFYHNWNMFVLSCDLDKHYIVSRGRELKSMARIWKMATQAILTLQWMVYR